MPDWWPLVKPAGDMDNLMFLLLPVLAALGYSDVAITNSPQEKSRHSVFAAGCLQYFPLGLSIAASHYRQFTLIPALALVCT